jgi:hypothetical protein
MSVEEGGRWQVMCCHGVGDATMFARRNGCVRLAERLTSQLRMRTYQWINGWIRFCADLKESRSVGRA